MSQERLDEIGNEYKAVLDNDDLSSKDKLEKLEALKVERDELVAAQSVKELAEAFEAPAVEEEEAPAVEADADSDEAAPADDADATPETTEEAPAEELTTEKVAEAVAAAATDAPTTNPVEDAKPALVASADYQGMTTGSDITIKQMARVHRAASQSENASQPFGHIRIFEPDTHTLSANNSAHKNTAIMASSQDRPASLTAAACFCGPDEAVKDIDDLSQTNRPVQDLFSVSSTSGRFNYVRPIDIATADNGTAIWECTDQDAIDPGNEATWKQCVDLECENEITVEPHNIYQCANISVQTQMSNPQLVDNLLHKLAVSYARRAEQKLLDEIVSESHVFTVSSADTGTASLLGNLELVGGQLPALRTFENRHSLDGWVAVLSPSLSKSLYADQHLRGGKDTRLSDEISAQIRESLGVSQLVSALDVDSSGVAAYTAAIGALPAVGQANATPWVPGTNNVAEHSVYIFHPDAFRHGSSDVVDAGFIRDGDLARRNQVRYFFEGQEFLEKVANAPAYTLRITGCPNGVATAPDVAPLCEPAP